MIGPEDLLLACLRGKWPPWVDGGWASSETECLGGREPTELWVAVPPPNLKETDPLQSLGRAPLGLVAAGATGGGEVGSPQRGRGERAELVVAGVWGKACRASEGAAGCVAVEIGGGFDAEEREEGVVGGIALDEAAGLSS